MLNFIFLLTPLKFLVSSFWRDEAVSFLMAKGSLLQIFSLTARDFNPPLYYVLLHFWMKVFGHSEVALRLMSLFFFWDAMYVFFLFLVDILKIKEKPAFLYLLLFLLNPLLNYYAFEARMYSLFLFLGLLSYYYFLLRKPRRFIIFTFLGLLTHYFIIFVVLSQAVFVFADRDRRREAKIFLIQLFKIFLLFSPWAIYVLLQKSPFGGSFWISPPPVKTLIDVPAVIYTGYEYNLNSPDLAVTVLSLILFIFLGLSLYILSRKNHRHQPYFKMLIIWNLIPFAVFLISLVKPVFLPRYLIFVTPGLLLLIIYCLENYPARSRVLLLSALLAITLILNSFEIGLRNKEDVGGVVREIKGLMKPGDVIYVTSELNFHPAEYYLNTDQVFIYGKRYDAIPQYVGKVLIPKEKVVSFLPLYPRRAFIIKDNLTYDIQSIR